MKKILLLFVLVLLLSGCGGKQAGVDSSPPPGFTDQPGTEVQTASEVSPPSAAEQSTDTAGGSAAVSGSSAPADKPPQQDPAAAGANTGSSTIQNSAPAPAAEAAAPVAAATAPEASSAPVSEPAPAVSAHPKSEQTVTVSVTDDEGNAILSPCAIEFSQGDTVLDILIKAGKQKGVSVVYSGKKSNGYVEGIGNLFEFDKGPESGWMYSVNGKFGEKSSGGVKAAQGDVIEWRYTTKLGRDLGQAEY